MARSPAWRHWPNNERPAALTELIPGTREGMTPASVARWHHRLAVPVLVSRQGISLRSDTVVCLPSRYSTRGPSRSI